MTPLLAFSLFESVVIGLLVSALMRRRSRESVERIEEEPTPEPITIGDEFELGGALPAADPWRKRMFVTVVDVRPGWVRYCFTGGFMATSKPERQFRELYSRVPPT